MKDIEEESKQNDRMLSILCELCKDQDVKDWMNAYHRVMKHRPIELIATREYTKLFKYLTSE